MINNNINLLGLLGNWCSTKDKQLRKMLLNLTELYYNAGEDCFEGEIVFYQLGDFTFRVIDSADIEINLKGKTYKVTPETGRQRISAQQSISYARVRIQNYLCYLYILVESEEFTWWHDVSTQDKNVLLLRTFSDENMNERTKECLIAFIACTETCPTGKYLFLTEEDFTLTDKKGNRVLMFKSGEVVPRFSFRTEILESPDGKFWCEVVVMDEIDHELFRDTPLGVYIADGGEK